MNGVSGSSGVGFIQPGVGFVPQGPVPNASLLPAPMELSNDALIAIQQLFSAGNNEDSKGAKIGIEVADARKKHSRQEQIEATERARKAQEEEAKGFFDSIGIGGLAGILACIPIIALADICMHMANLTPDFLKDFENDNKGAIELATKVCVVAGGPAMAASGLGTSSVGASAAVGGILIQETEVFGKEASDWIGTAMLVAGTGGSAAVVLADKDSAVATEIRQVEQDTKEYTKWAAAVGMAVSAAALLVASAGTAAFVSTMMVVAIGVALSAGGTAIAETKCLDDVIGKDASQWVGGGMALLGGLVTGVGGAVAIEGIQTASTTATALRVSGQAVSGAAKARQGLETVHTTAVQYEVEREQNVAKKFGFETQRLQRVVEDIIEEVRDCKDSYRRVAGMINQAIETQCQTQLIAVGMKV